MSQKALRKKVDTYYEFRAFTKMFFKICFLIKIIEIPHVVYQEFEIFLL